LAWQIALAAHDFSPGILDGNFGPHSLMALREYAAAKFPGVNPLNPHDPRVFDALGVDVKHVTATYTISSTDAQAVGHEHYHWRTMAAANRMPYGSMEGCICEKFHCTRRLLARLNPGIRLSALRQGQTINVPNIQPFPAPDVDFGVPGGLSAVIAADKADLPHPHVAYLVINIRQKVIRAYNARKQEVALFHCSIPAINADMPTRDAYIKDIALNPNYTFLPSVFKSVHDIHHPLLIPPGPRNPVGVVWMGLSIPNVGMHGNPQPQYIGLTGSHGCFRMTNWDAVNLLTLVHIGLPVFFVNSPVPIQGGPPGPALASQPDDRSAASPVSAPIQAGY
jgi:lipoprotein-anchoring transpeptidase ErfK/SrfK